MKYILIISLLIISHESFSQDTIKIDSYSSGIFCLILNGADYNYSPVKVIQSNLKNWLYLKVDQSVQIDYIELSFLERVFKPTEFSININNNIDTLLIEKRNWKIEINDTLNSFSLNTIANTSSPTIDSIRFFENGMIVEHVINHKSSIDDLDVSKYHSQMKDRLIKAKPKEYIYTDNFYKQHIIKLINSKQRSEVIKMLSEYHKSPICELSKLTLSFADQFEELASNFISGKISSKWSRSKMINKSKKEYLKAAKLYRRAQSLGCIEGNNIIYKAVAAYNQAEKFHQAEDLLKPYIENSKYDDSFFSYYFMTKCKISLAKGLRENGFIYYGCGGSLDIIDSEYFYSNIVLKNTVLLYRTQEYDLLIEYLKKSRIRINWSSDVRLNEINKVICQMLIQSLLQKHSSVAVKEEFNNAEIYEEEFDFYGVGDSSNRPKGTLKIFEVPLKLYDINSSYAKYSKQKNHKPLIDFERKNENMKEKTIIYELLNEMLQK